MDYDIKEIEELREIPRYTVEQDIVKTLKEMKEDTEEFRETQTSFSVRREFEEGSVTSADEVPIHTDENIKKGEGDCHSMIAESKIGKDGGTLDIQNTGVSLEIPPGALQRDYVIRMRIIPHHHLDDAELSFASNSSVVVELLPNNVKLLIPATLTLPHCLVLKKKCGWKAKVYSSHHKEGDQPQWEEERNTQCDVTYETCVIRLYNFCLKKVEIGDQIVEAKKIVLFAAKDSLSTQNVIYLHVGYYWRLASCPQVLRMNRFIVLKVMPVVFYRKGELPLTILFDKVVPPNWTYNEAINKKEISFNTVATTEESFCTFVLNKMAPDETDRCTCYFNAGQGSDHVELIFPLMESSLSRTEAIIPSTRNDTAGDTQEELPSAIVQTEEIAVSDESLQNLAENIGNCWRDVGRKLNLTDGQLDILDTDYSSNHRKKVYQMLHMWKRGIAATDDVLSDALKSAGRADLLREITRNPFEQHVATSLKEMKEDTKEVRETQTSLSVRREFEEGSVTSADKVPIHTGKIINKDEGDSHSMRAESMIGKDGGTLEIPNTGVSLEIPPGALQLAYYIQMRIIPHHYLDETVLSFASNSSVVVELLPNNVKLIKPVTLTLPHCLVLKKNCKRKAKVYSSHHKEGK